MQETRIHHQVAVIISQWYDLINSLRSIYYTERLNRYIWYQNKCLQAFENHYNTNFSKYMHVQITSEKQATKGGTRI